jgi:xanthine dehydrogenase iron-sulfur cluster and FAD-binding subunit A
LHWPALQASPAGLDIAATCRIVELYRFDPPPEWTVAPLFRLCCDSLLGSFKIWNAATIGGNICMSLPAGPMISLTTALEATYTLWPAGCGTPGRKSK